MFLSLTVLKDTPGPDKLSIHLHVIYRAIFDTNDITFEQPVAWYDLAGECNRALQKPIRDLLPACMESIALGFVVEEKVGLKVDHFRIGAKRDIAGLIQLSIHCLH